jgi:hypothetical protein
MGVRATQWVASSRPDRVAVLAHPATAYLTLPDTQRGARTLGLKLQVLDVSDPNEFDRTLSAISKERASSLRSNN